MPSAWPDLLERLYGTAIARELAPRVADLIRARAPEIPERLRRPLPRLLSEREAILITYADQVSAAGSTPLQTLHRFLRETVPDLFTGAHLLPFYPWTSDDGFAVKDYHAVDPAVGTWNDLRAMGGDFDLMFDAVFNHLSSRSDWFLQFLAGDPERRDFFVTVTGDPDLSGVVRPRTLPLLTEFRGAGGAWKVWTTFGPDQVDLDLRNPEVLLALLEVLLFYVSQGARFIRLDAIAYLWKEIGTSCIHLPQTHQVIQCFRAVLDDLAPQVQLITETNVPHADNVSYFGTGENEAQLVYNFALPPLLVHSIRTGDATTLRHWAANLQTPGPEVTFFNFLASHDGIGLNPVRGILAPGQIDDLVRGTLERGGLISYKSNPDGTRSPYEMNINFLDALADPKRPESSEELARRLLVAHAVLLALPGLPGLYFHSVFGSRGDRAGADASGIPRRINRQKNALDPLRAELAQPGSLRHRVLAGFRELLTARRSEPAFAPAARLEILESVGPVFALRRLSLDGRRSIRCLHHLGTDPVTLALDARPVRILIAAGAECAGDTVRLDGHGYLWCQTGE